jgi:hypothetical protein
LDITGHFNFLNVNHILVAMIKMQRRGLADANGVVKFGRKEFFYFYVKMEADPVSQTPERF